MFVTDTSILNPILVFLVMAKLTWLFYPCNAIIDLAVVVNAAFLFFETSKLWVFICIFCR